MVAIVTPAFSWPVMNSWCSPIAGQVTCRSRVSASSGNHSRTRAAHSSSLAGGPPGRTPAPAATAVYLRIVRRSTPRLAAIWFCDRPACQWIKISEISITSKILLAIGPPPLQTGRTLLLPDGQVHPTRTRHAHGQLRDRGEQLRDRYPLNPGEFRDRPHSMNSPVKRCTHR